MASTTNAFLHLTFYSNAIQVDPVNGCSFYALHEYAPVAPSSWGTWNTRIANFRLANCV